MTDKPSSSKALQVAFASHPRHWRRFHYVYPVISRRACGMSLGVNLNPDMACNFDCIYCQVDRTQPPPRRDVDLAVLREELEHLLRFRAALFDEPEFRDIPDAYRRLNDIAFSGDGEPTAAPTFPEAARIAAELRTAHGLTDAKIVIITDACFLTRPKVAGTLDFLAAHGGEVWAKLDAGTEDYFRTVARPSHSLELVLNEITTTAQRQPLVIQSLFMRVHGAAPPAAEIAAYVERLRQIVAAGGTLKLVQVYTIARQTAEAYATPLTPAELEPIAAAVRATGLPVEVFS